jgi:hypothetical protein
MTLQLFQNDIAPDVQVTITESESGSIVDLTGTKAFLDFKKSSSATILCTLDGFQANDSDLSNGIVTFLFGSDDLYVASGDYEGRVKIQHDNGTVDTVDNVVNFYITSDL